MKMSKLVITSINMQYDDGQEENYTGASVYFTTVGGSFTLEGDVSLNSTAYSKAMVDGIDGLREKVMMEVVYEFGYQIVTDD